MAKENRGDYFLYNNNKYLGDTLNDHHAYLRPGHL